MSEGVLVARYRNIDDDTSVEVEDDGSRVILYIVRDGGPALSASITPETASKLGGVVAWLARLMERRRRV